MNWEILRRKQPKKVHPMLTEEQRNTKFYRQHLKHIEKIQKYLDKEKDGKIRGELSCFLLSKKDLHKLK